MQTIGSRLWRAAQKLAAGVPLGGERVWPGQATDLFVAHVSLYHFFAGEAAGKRVLDAGCGLGYGSALLADAGAEDVLGCVHATPTTPAGDDGINGRLLTRRPAAFPI